MFKKRMQFSAFTLAEVLITLGIIGVVAAITIPTLMNKTNNKETATALKKTYSTLSQAYTLAVQEKGTPDNWGITTTSTGCILVLNTLATYLNVTKNCATGTGCIPDVTLTWLNGTPWVNLNQYGYYSRAMLADGTWLYIDAYDCSTASPICAYIAVDTNGFKSPNKVGADIFYFYLKTTGISPLGSAQDSLLSFDANCKDKSTASGNSCAAWVIYNENLDYLKCSNLSWTGNKTCQ